MNFLLAILLCTSVIIHVVIGAKKKTVESKEADNGWIHETPITYSEGMPKKGNSKRQNHKKPKPLYTITEVIYKGKTVYKCNGQIFHKLNDANECLRKLNHKRPVPQRPAPQKPPRPQRPAPQKPPRPHRPTPQIPPSVPLIPSRPAPPPPIPPRRPQKPNRHHPRPVNHNHLQDHLQKLHIKQKEQLARRFRNFSIKKFLSKSKFSNKIYQSVWSNCDFLCYFEIGFANYKSRVLTQINIFRVYHKVQLLKENAYLNKLAQEHADKMRSKRTLLKDQSSLYGIVVGMAYYPAASVMVTKWYDEHHKYSFLLSKPIPGTQSFTQMVWKNTKYIGIGVAKKDDLLFVACFYFPRGNIDGQYRKNVLRRKFIWFGKY